MMPRLSGLAPLQRTIEKCGIINNDTEGGRSNGTEEYMERNDREQFILDNQQAFMFGAECASRSLLNVWAQSLRKA